MAELELIVYTPMREAVHDGVISWVSDTVGRVIEGLPQIFWSTGLPWSEANHWALFKATARVGSDLETVNSLMKHLTAYANYLESEGLDWRSFPMRKQDRTVFRFRGALIARRDAGTLMPSTATARMRAVIQFYRHSAIFGFVDTTIRMWDDREVLVRYHDTVGFERTLVRASSELGIRNTRREGIRLEDGLLPLSKADASRLLQYARDYESREMQLILSLGALVGARFETITTLGTEDIENAYADPEVPDVFHLRVGPGTKVRTKFDVSGEILVPSFLLEELKFYIGSVQRLTRLARACKDDRRLIFLTIRGHRYKGNTFTRLMTDLRRRALARGLPFLKRFKFHQMRATYGTWLMDVCLRVTTVAAAIAFVMEAMLHKDEGTTMRYVKFLEQTPAKAEMANEFTALFSGLIARDWSSHRA